MFTSSSSSDEDSEDDSEDDEESEEDSELLSLPESDSSFFLAATLGFLVFSSDESEEPEDSDSEEEPAAFYLIWVEGVVAAFWSFAASLAARASSSDQIGFSLNVASCFS